MHKVKHVILITLFLLVTAGMGLSVYYSISGDKEADYVVETNVPFTPFEYYKNREIVGKALSPKARPFCDRQVVPTKGGLRGSLLHAVPVP